MPECLLYAYHEHLDRLRAERQLDDALSATTPHMTKEGRSSYFRGLNRRIARPAVQQASVDARRPFTIDGKPTDANGLKRWLVSTFSLSAQLPAGPGQRPTANGAAHPAGTARP